MAVSARLLLVWDDDEDVVETTLDQFLDANADGLDAAEIAAIRDDLETHGITHGAGAQSLRWTLGTPWAVTEYLSRPEASRPGTSLQTEAA